MHETLDDLGEENKHTAYLYHFYLGLTRVEIHFGINTLFYFIVTSHLLQNIRQFVQGAL